MPELAKWHRTRSTVTGSHSPPPPCTPPRKRARRTGASTPPWNESRPESFAGLHNEGKRIVLIFDEGSAIADEIYEVGENA